MGNAALERDLDAEQLRLAIQGEYEAVARNPEKGFHFHTGHPLTRILGYDEEWLEGIPETAIGSNCGAGCPCLNRSSRTPQKSSRVDMCIDRIRQISIAVSIRTTVGRRCSNQIWKKIRQRATDNMENILKG